MFTDKQLKCADCGADFTFTAGEQEKFQQLGFTNEPRRCAPCRAARKASGGGGGGYCGGGGGGYGGGRKEMFSVVCSECGKPAQVPFKPRGDRPVFCSDCFAQRRG